MRDQLSPLPRRIACGLAVLAALASGASERVRAQEPSPAAPRGEPAYRQGLVLDERGRPLEGVRVSVLDGANWTIDDSMQRVVATTDVDGRYRLRVDADQQNPADGAAEPALAWHRPGRATVLTSLRFLGNQLPPVVLRPGRTLLARVVDGDGQPLAGIRVVAEQHVPGAVPFGMLAQAASAARSDSKGIAKLVGAALHGVEVQVVEPGFAWTRTLPGSFEGIVELRSARTGEIVGQVVGPSGEPLAQPGLSIECVDDAGASQEVVTDAEGRFRFWRRSLLRHRVQWVGEPDLEREGWPAGPVVEVGPDDVAPIRVVVPREAGAPEEAASEPVAAQVLVVDDASGEPVAGARLFQAARVPGLIEALAAMGRAENLELAVTDERGIAELAKMPARRGAAGWLSAVVLAPGRAPWSGVPSALPQDEGEPKRYEVRVRPGAAVRGVVRGAESGEPLAGVQVALLPKARPGGGSFDMKRAHWRAVSDQQGRFRVHGLSAGEWELRAVADGRPSLEGIAVTASADPAAEGVDVTMPAGVRLVGTVEGLGALPPGVRVRVVEPTGRMPNAAGTVRQVGIAQGDGQALDADARFVVDGLAEGRHLVELLVPDLNLGEAWAVTQIGEFEVGPDDVGQVEQEVRELERTFDAAEAVPGLVTGRLRLSEGLDAPRGRLAVVARYHLPPRRELVFQMVPPIVVAPRRTFLGHDGSFALRLKPGVWSLGVEDVLAGSELEVDGGVEVEPGSEQRIEADLLLGAVRITLREQPGRPGAFGAAMALVPERGDEGLRGAPGIAVLRAANGLGGAKRIDLAGLPNEFTVLLPRRKHQLCLWEARMVAEERAEMRRMVRGADPAMDAKIEIEPRVGEVVEVEFGLGDGR